MTLLLLCWFRQLSIMFVSSNISISLRNLIFIRHNLFQIIFISLWILYFLLLFFYLGHCWWKCLVNCLYFPHATFLHVGCWFFLDIKYMWATVVKLSNIEPAQFDLHIDSNCCGYFPTYQCEV